MSSTSVQDFVFRVVTPIVVAATLGVWAFASSRASRAELIALESRTDADISRLETKTQKLENRIIVKLEDLQDKTVEIQIEQAEFRSELRQMLRPSD